MPMKLVLVVVAVAQPAAKEETYPLNGQAVEAVEHKQLLGLLMVLLIQIVAPEVQDHLDKVELVELNLDGDIMEQGKNGIVDTAVGAEASTVVPVVELTEIVTN